MSQIDDLAFLFGAVKIGSYWAIPEDAEKPKDKRIEYGKYIKQ